MSSTQQFQFDTVESPYGPKLAVQFSYSKDVVAAIKRLNWSRTHRSYNDPSDPGGPRSLWRYSSLSISSRLPQPR